MGFSRHMIDVLVDEGYDLTALIPSCVLMYKQELPLLYPDDADVKKVQAAFFDPFEYLWLRAFQGQQLRFRINLQSDGLQVLLLQ